MEKCKRSDRKQAFTALLPSYLTSKTAALRLSKSVSSSPTALASISLSSTNGSPSYGVIWQDTTSKSFSPPPLPSSPSSSSSSSFSSVSSTEMSQHSTKLLHSESLGMVNPNVSYFLTKEKPRKVSFAHKLTSQLKSLQQYRTQSLDHFARENCRFFFARKIANICRESLKFWIWVFQVIIFFIIKTKFSLHRHQVLWKDVFKWSHIDRSRQGGRSKAAGPPWSADEVRSFLFFAGASADFVAGFAQITSPLWNFTRDYVKFQWTPTCQQSFERVKSMLTEDISPPRRGIFTEVAVVGGPIVRGNTNSSSQVPAPEGG